MPLSVFEQERSWLGSLLMAFLLRIATGRSTRF
jgi:hypothetical protein